MNYKFLTAILSFAPLPALFPAGVASLLSSLCSILLLGASAYLIASAALHPPLYTLALSITLVRACGIGRAVFRYLDRWLSHRAVFRAQEKLRLRLYEKASFLLPLRESGPRQGEFLQDLAKGCDALRDFYLRSLIPPVLALILSLACTAFLLPVIGPPGCLLPLLLWGIHVILPVLLDRREYEDVKKAAVRYEEKLFDFCGGWEELQSAGSAVPVAEGLHAVAGELGICRKRQSHRRDQVDILLLVLGELCLVLLFLLLCDAALRGRIGGVELAVCFLAIQTVMGELSPLAEALRAWRQGISAARSVLHLPEPAPIRLPADSQEGGESIEAASPPLLSLRDVGFSYLPGIPVLRGVSFDLFPGEKIAIVGESGCGKTTLGYLLMGLWAPEEGSIRLEGRDYGVMTPEEIRRAFAPCLQGEYVMNHSLKDIFLDLHPGIREEEIWKALSIACLDEIIRNLPQGLDTPLGENACRLSGGERQRLLAALALPSPAPILLLDEPTAGLDEKTARRLMTGILSHLEGRGLLLITHDMVLADQMDRIIRMDRCYTRVR